MRKTRYFPGINGLRAVAAFLVVLQHSIFYACLAVKVDVAPYLRTGFGGFGVMLFFCISGFVITLNRHLSVGEFVARRILRVYPPYLIACALSIVASNFIGGSPYIDIKSLLLVPTAPGELNDSLHIPYWTLIFEIAFYALAAVVFSFRLPDRSIAVGAVTWILVVQLCGPYFSDDLFSKAPGWAILVSPYTQLFAMGSIACLYFDRINSIDTVAILFLAVMTFVLPSLVTMQPAVYILCYGISGTCIVLSAARATSAVPVVDWLGEASFGVYLLHLPILVVQSASFAGETTDPITVWAVMTATALALSTAFGIAESSQHSLLISVLNSWRRRSPLVGSKEEA
jgi:peptidoglycan/LPS O-acetylase OafA/YrhL